jgi:hypothetical protein
VRFPLLIGVILRVIVSAIPMLLLLGFSKMVGLFTVKGLTVAVIGGISYIGVSLFNGVFEDGEKQLILRRIDVPFLRQVWLRTSV